MNPFLNEAGFFLGKLNMKLWQFLLQLDKDANHKLFGGNEGETISSRLGRHIKNRNCWPCRIFCRTILLPLGVFINKDFKHCKKSIQKEFDI